MRDALYVIWTTLQLAWEESLLLAQLNLLVSLVVALSLIPTLVQGDLDISWRLGLSAMPLMLLPPLLGALSFVTNQIARERAVSWKTFWSGLQRFWAKSYGVALLFLLGLVLVPLNLWFYGNLLGPAWLPAVRLLGGTLLALWLIMQLYWFPMLLELRSESIRDSLRNALLLSLLTPLFTLGVSLAALLFLVLSLVLLLPMLFIGCALLCLLGNLATRSRLAYVQQRRQTTP
jgi:uncharacterized membrane protein YesL